MTHKIDKRTVLKYSTAVDNNNERLPFDTAITFCAAMKIFEFVLDGVLLTNRLFRELHVSRVEDIGELSFTTEVTIAVSLGYDDIH